MATGTGAPAAHSPGVRGALERAHHVTLYWCGGAFARVTRGRRRFRFRGVTYPYCHARYNYSWSNERAVEVPLARAALDACPGGRVLEVGNVLRHYGKVSHPVVDKYEEGPGVLNVDVVDYAPEERFDLIVSMSTLEHVGWDESPREPRKVLGAVEHLRGLLAPGGQLFVTIPLGYNPVMDALLAENAFGFDDRGFLERVSADNRWVEAGPELLEGATYASPFPGANRLFVGGLRRAP